MSATPARSDLADTSGLIGVRTQGSDLVRWSVWTGDRPPEQGQWVRLLDTGELGRVSVAPGQPVGVFELDVLPRVSPVNDDDTDFDDAAQVPMPGAWGRIGPIKNVASEGMKSSESIKYRRLKADMPALGGRIATDHGSGVVIALDIFKGRLFVRLDMASDVVEVQYRSLPLADANCASSGITADTPSE